MIDKKLVERCSSLIARENVNSYFCLVLTDDDQTVLDYTASIIAISTMLANAAINNPELLTAIEIAYETVEEFLAENK